MAETEWEDITYKTVLRPALREDTKITDSKYSCRCRLFQCLDEDGVNACLAMCIYIWSCTRPAGLQYGINEHAESVDHISKPDVQDP